MKKLIYIIKHANKSTSICTIEVDDGMHVYVNTDGEGYIVYNTIIEALEKARSDIGKRFVKSVVEGKPLEQILDLVTELQNIVLR